MNKCIIDVFVSLFSQPPATRLVESRARREENGTELLDPNIIGNIKIRGLRLEASYKEAEYDDNGVPGVLADAEHTLRLFGEEFTERMTVTFTRLNGTFGQICVMPAVEGFSVSI